MAWGWVRLLAFASRLETIASIAHSLYHLCLHSQTLRNRRTGRLSVMMTMKMEKARMSKVSAFPARSTSIAL